MKIINETDKNEILYRLEGLKVDTELLSGER